MATRYYTASSVDGFIADPDHSLSWLFSRDIDGDGPMSHGAFMQSVGAAVMGASTYQWLLDNEIAGDPDKAWPMDVPCWVFANRELQVVPGDLHVVRGPVAPVHEEVLRVAGDQDVWVVGGGDLAGQFADAGLLDEVWVQWAPVALGAGAPLLPRRLELRLEDVARNRDFACARYSVVRTPAAG